MKKEFIQKKEPQKANLKFAFWGVFLVFFSVYFLLFTNSVSAATLTKAPNNLGLVAYFSLNEGAGTIATDFSGYGNHGTLLDGPTWVDGKLGKAVNFDTSVDTNDRISVSGSSGLNTGTITVSAWIYWKGSSDRDVIIQMANPSDDLWFNVNTTAGQDKLGIYFQDLASPGYYESTAPIPRNTFTHVSATWDGSFVRLYINGVLDSQNGTTGSVNIDSSSWMIGASEGLQSTMFFNGIIDEVRVYNRALSGPEIYSLYSSGSIRRSTPTNLGLIAHWSFNEGIGTQAGDFSGTGNHGTLQSFSEPPTATSGWGAGRFGTGLNFDGTNDYISTTIQYTNPNPFTISGWFKTTSASGRKIIGFENTQTGTGGSQYDRHIYMGTDGKIYFGWYPGSPATVASTNALNDGQWHHFLATHNGSTGQLFIDGVSQGTNTGAPQSYSGYWRLGGFKLATWTNAGDGYFVGAVDDVRIYNRVLSAEERAVLFRAGGETKVNTTPTNFLTDGLVGHWTFDGKDMNWTTGTLSDKSSQGNNGQVVGMSTTTTPTIGKIGQAFDFDGVNDQVNIDSPVYPANTNWSISAWVKSSASGKVVYGEGQNGVNGRKINLLSVTGKLRIQIQNTAGNILNLSSTSDVFDGNWHHFVFSDANGSAVLYIDGVQDASNFNYTRTGTFPQDSSNIGCIQEISCNDWFSGYIDDVRLYNRALSASEMKQLYLMGK